MKFTTSSPFVSTNHSINKKRNRMTFSYDLTCNDSHSLVSYLTRYFIDERISLKIFQNELKISWRILHVISSRERKLKCNVYLKIEITLI